MAIRAHHVTQIISISSYVLYAVPSPSLWLGLRLPVGRPAVGGVLVPDSRLVAAAAVVAPVFDFLCTSLMWSRKSAGRLEEYWQLAY